MGEPMKVLQDVPHLKWGESECTFIGALDAALRYLGEKVDYVDLMGMSAAAFRIHFHPEWCPSSPDWFPRENAARFAGYTLHPVHLWGDDEVTKNKRKEESLRIAREEIGQGNPVIAIDLISPADWGLITGYDGEKLLCQTYWSHQKKSMYGIPVEREHGYSIAHNYPWILYTLKKPGLIPTKKQCVLDAIKLGVEQFNINEFDGQKSGKAAIEYWISQLLDEKNFTGLDEKTFHSKWHVNAWVFDSLDDARSAAHSFLERVVPDFDEATGKKLIEAAGVYKSISKMTWDNLIHFPFAFWVNMAEQGKIWIPGDRSVDGTMWTEKMRKNGAESLQLILDKEIQAMEILASIL